MASVLFDPVEQGVFLCEGNYLDHRLANIKIKTFIELIGRRLLNSGLDPLITLVC